MPAPPTTFSTGKTALNLGNGKKRIEDAVNLDITAETNPDVVHDLNQRPWPFANDAFEKVFAYDVIEHLENIPATMEEIQRICRPGAIVRITVPHFSSANAFTDPTHRHFFSKFSMDYFTTGHPTEFYSQARFLVRAAQIQFYPTLVNKLVHRLANRFPEKYEQRWAWIFPAWFMFYELEVVKK
jgi:SAM-dependent methyltransferase